MNLVLTTCLLLLAFQEGAPREAPRSLFTAPLYLEDEPPECRAAAVIMIAAVERKPEAVAALAASLVERARAGEDFAALARAHSDGLEADFGGVLGALAPGVLEGEAGRFLFSAAVGEVSDPIETEQGTAIWTRVERWAASEHVLIPGTDAAAQERARELLGLLREGGDLAPAAASEGLRYRRDAFERGPRDRLLKLATFRAAVGESFGPLKTPQGTVIGRRVRLDAVPVAERENHWIRVRALVLLTPDDLADEERALAHVRSKLQIERLHDRARAGESLAALASEHTEEPTARARGGDLGWIHRFHPNRSSLLDGLFVVDPGTLGYPLAFRDGWVVFERTR